MLPKRAVAENTDTSFEPAFLHYCNFWKKWKIIWCGVFLRLERILWYTLLRERATLW